MVQLWVPKSCEYPGRHDVQFDPVHSRQPTGHELVHSDSKDVSCALSLTITQSTTNRKT